MASFKANAVVLGSALVILAVCPQRTGAQQAQKADQAPAAAGAPQKAGEREVIPGADRMSSAERDSYRLRMAAAASPEEKTRIRA